MFVVVAADQQVATVEEAQAQAEKMAARDNTGRKYVVAQVLGTVEAEHIAPVTVLASCVWPALLGWIQVSLANTHGSLSLA